MTSHVGSARPAMTTMPQSSSAADRFFDIPELVDHTLLLLPPADVVRARQLNSYFNGRVLAATKELRRHLFVTPESNAEFIRLKNCIEEFRCHLLYEKVATSSSTAPKIMRVHPVLERFLRPLPADSCTTLPNRDTWPLSMQDVLDWSSGPWQDMLLTQPPCQIVRCLYYSRQAAGTAVHEVNGLDFSLGDGQFGVTLALPLINGDGVTLGDLRKQLELYAKGHYPSKPIYQLVQLCLRTFPPPVTNWDQDIMCYHRTISADHDPLGTNAEVFIGIPWERTESQQLSSEGTDARLG